MHIIARAVVPGRWKTSEGMIKGQLLLKPLHVSVELEEGVSGEGTEKR